MTGLFLLCSALAAGGGVDLVVAHGTVLTLDPRHRILEDGAVAISSGRIVAVGGSAEISASYKAREVLDASRALVIPGLVNAHTHAPMVLFRGMADDLNLADWLEHFIFPAEAKNVDPEFVKAGTRLAMLEMIRSGTTTFADMYYFEGDIAEVVREAGMRGVLGETILDLPAPDHKTPREALAYTDGFLSRFHGDPLVVPAVAPHSTYLCSPDTLKAVGALASRYNAPLLIHLSETRDERSKSLTRHGKTPPALLSELGLLRKGLVAAHGVWLDAADRALLRSSGAGVVHCPQSNLKLASGIAPVPEMLREGVVLGLGTDGAASNNDLDMFEEMGTAALLGKVESNDPRATPAAAVLEMATLGGARVLGLDDQIGSLEVGKRADLVVVSLEAARMHPLYDPVSQLVYAAKGADVRHVVVEGRVLLRDRRALTLDETSVLAEADRLKERVRQSLPGSR